ncbi:uncharacterized protein LOC144094108 isoform X2 [Amblyomma americanum]
MFSFASRPAVASAPPATSRFVLRGAPCWTWLLLLLWASVTVSTASGVTPPTEYERSQKLADTGGAALSMPEASWRGYPRLFTERTSSLLSEAVQMLHRAKDVQERRWLQALVQRLTKLAVDLKRSTLSLRSSPAPSPGHESFQQEQTVPTTGQISPPPSPSSSGQGARTTTQESVQDEVRGLGRPDAVTQPNLFRDEGDDPLTRQLQYQWRRLESKATAALDSPGATGGSGKQPHGLRSPARLSVGGASSLEERDASLDLNKIQTLIALGMTDVTKDLQKRRGRRLGSSVPRGATS